MAITEERENVEMYQKYGITEWREKSIILGEYAAPVKKSLEYGIDSPLVTIAKLPFPEFATVYFNTFSEIDNLTSDIAFGYKLYLLSYTDLKLFRDTVLYREGGKTDESLKHACRGERSFHLIRKRLELPLEELSVTDTASNKRKQIDFRFIYIAQYIDTKEAERLNLKIFSLLCADEDLNGYNIEGKLRLLNPVARTIIAKTIGMYGYDMTPTIKLIQELGINKYYVEYFINTLMPYMLRPTGEFKNKLRIVDADTPGMVEYLNPKYREYDIKVECLHFLERVVTLEESQILSNLTSKNRRLYIASKNFGWTTEQVCRNLIVVPDDIEKVYELAKKAQNGD